MNNTKDKFLKFFFRVTFGSEFNLITSKDKDQQEHEDKIITSCLCLGWNDGFKRTLKNRPNVNIERKDKVNAFINSGAIDVFRTYANAATPEEKADILIKFQPEMEKEIRPFKKIDENERLSLGILQKIFNIAVKLYYCIYLYRDFLDLDGIVKEYNFEKADCPIDNLILDKLEKNKDFKAAIKPHNYRPWSRINDKETYVLIQSYCGDNRLDFDLENW